MARKPKHTPIPGLIIERGDFYILHDGTSDEEPEVLIMTTVDSFTLQNERGGTRVVSYGDFRQYAEWLDAGDEDGDEDEDEEPELRSVSARKPR